MTKRKSTERQTMIYKTYSDTHKTKDQVTQTMI